MITQSKMKRIQFLYEAGESVERICSKMGISRQTVYTYASRDGWVRNKDLPVKSVKITDTERDRFLEGAADRVLDLNERYLERVGQIDRMLVEALSSYVGPDGKSLLTTVDKSESERIYAILKNLKASSEISAMNYQGARKALGADLDTGQEVPQLLPIQISVSKKALEKSKAGGVSA